MTIKGLTDRGASFPRIGELRKGAEKPAKGNRPGADLKYFRFTSKDKDARLRFAAVYKSEPTSINVYLPFATTGENFEAWREEWVAGGLVHRCDGETAVIWRDRNGYSQTPKPCPGNCKQVGRLKVIIPELERLACVVALTTSTHDIIELHANIAAVEAMRGDLRGIPFILSRVPRMISTPTKDGGRARREKWLLHIEAAPEWVRNQLGSMARKALPNSPIISLPESPPDAPDALDIELEDSRGEASPQAQAKRGRPLPPTERLPTEKQIKQFHAVGVETYGKDKWDAQRAKLVAALNKESSTELTMAEMTRLIDGMNEKKAKS